MFGFAVQGLWRRGQESQKVNAGWGRGFHIFLATWLVKQRGGGSYCCTPLYPYLILYTHVTQAHAMVHGDSKQVQSCSQHLQRNVFATFCFCFRVMDDTYDHYHDHHLLPSFYSDSMKLNDTNIDGVVEHILDQNE